MNPTNVLLNFTTNSGFFPSQTVTATPPAGASYYTVHTTSTGNWLLASTSNTAINPGGSFLMQISSQANSLAAGQYPGQALLTDSNGNTFTVTATLTVNGGSSSGLIISPNPVTFNAALNGATQSQTVTMYSNPRVAQLPPAVLFQAGYKPLLRVQATVSYGTKH